MGRPTQDREHIRQLADWRRIHTCYDRCAYTFMSLIRVATAVILRLMSMGLEPN